MLERVKRWVLAVLAMLAREERAARGSARLRSRRPKRAALLTRSARRGVLEVSGRRASPFRPSGGFDSPPAGRTKGMTKKERAKRGSKTPVDAYHTLCIQVIVNVCPVSP